MTTDRPTDWFESTVDHGAPAYLMTREGVILIAMSATGDVAMRAKVEIAQIVAARYRGQMFPRRAAPTMAMLLDFSKEPQPCEQPAPIEIAGGAAGFQKHLVELAKKNRGLEHAALTRLFAEHQVVMAVWDNADDGLGFLTLQGVEHVLAQLQRRKKITATLTALWCSSREHAEILQQRFAPLGADPSGGAA